MNPVSSSFDEMSFYFAFELFLYDGNIIIIYYEGKYGILWDAYASFEDKREENVLPVL